MGENPGCGKAWVACGYKTKEQLRGDKDTAVVPYTDEQVGLMVQKIIGNESCVNFIHDVTLVDPDIEHPEEYDSDYSDVEN